jgi:hypothetical protein
MSKKKSRPAGKQSLVNGLDALVGTTEKDTFACPDCRADVSLTKQYGIYVLAIAHDDTCPTLAARQRGNR